MLVSSPNGTAAGIDVDQSQVGLATENAMEREIANAQFRTASVYDLPFATGSLDGVFAHAVLEHLGEPETAVQEMCRVLEADGVLGVCSPDWGGFLLAPPSAELDSAISEYESLQIANGASNCFLLSKLIYTNLVLCLTDW